MLQSMTGYGQAVHEDDHRRISAEVKAINAKYADVNLRLPRAWAAYELAWGQLATTHLQRGKITLTVSYERKDTPALAAHINPTRFKAHYQALQALAQEVGATSPPLFQLALQAPDVMASTASTVAPAADQPLVEQVIQAALEQCVQNRQAEGAALAQQLVGCLQHIQKSLAQVEKRAPARAQAVSDKLRAGVTALVQEVDEQRLAQELLYYVERMDMTEEQVRLAQHLAYFEEVMQRPQAAGKKLGFIAQEMGREINTMGAKAHDAALQQEVILMKDALEKIKEQLQNIL
ncbi:MAG: YicC/YloC family endoribonuclease [Bacteroidota bacterium]